MKKFWLGLIIVLIILGIGGFFAYPYYQNWNATRVFRWGVTIRPNALGDFNSSNWKQQKKLAKDLGINATRLTWQYDASYKGKDDAYGFHDKIYNDLKENGMQILLVIEAQPGKQISDYYQEGFANGKEIATYYKGKIHYYQMMNEGGAQTIDSPTSNGQKTTDFDDAKYAIVRDYMRGVSDGIAQADSSAIKIISISWTHTGYLDRLVADGIKFDWIGLDWYDWMGPIQDKKMDDGTNFVDKLKSYDKPLVFTEVNAWPKGKTVNEQAQTDFTTQTADWAWANRPWVKGFYVLELVDNANVDNPNPEYFGLVAADKNAKGKVKLGDPRPAYQAFQELIKKYSK